MQFLLLLCVFVSFYGTVVLFQFPDGRLMPAGDYHAWLVSGLPLFLRNIPNLPSRLAHRPFHELHCLVVFRVHGERHRHQSGCLRFLKGDGHGPVIAYPVTEELHASRFIQLHRQALRSEYVETYPFHDTFVLSPGI